MNENKILHGYELPENFLKVFGFDYSNNISKLEIVFEAGKPSIVRTTFIDSDSITQELTIDMLKNISNAFES